MRAAAVFPGKRSVGLVDMEAPKLRGPRDVKFRVLEVGVCGTDREIAAFEYGAPPAGGDYLVLGHECLGEVVEVGPEVEGWQPGDLLVPSVRRPCTDPACTACRAGHQDFCYTGRYTERGINHYHGFMTELVVDDAQYLNHVPAGLRGVGVLVEPVTIVEKALLQVNLLQQRLPWACAVEPGKPPHHCHKAVVLGAGPVGLLGAMALVVAGYETYMYSRSIAPTASSKICDQIGVKYISAQQQNAEQMAQTVGNIDLVYEAVGVPPFAFDVLQVLGINGVFVMTGVPGPFKPVSVDTSRIMKDLVLKNQVVLGTVNASREAFEHAISDLNEFHRRWPDAVQALITGRFSIDRFEEPLQSAAGIKNVIEVGV